MESFADCFAGLADPRAGNARRHDLHEVLLIALCTFLCGGESCVDMADLAEEKEEFLREFLTLGGGLHPDARNRHQDDDGDGLLSPEFAAVCRTFWTGGARALGGRE